MVKYVYVRFINPIIPIHDSTIIEFDNAKFLEYNYTFRTRYEQSSESYKNIGMKQGRVYLMKRIEGVVSDKECRHPLNWFW